MRVSEHLIDMTGFEPMSVGFKMLFVHFGKVGAMVDFGSTCAPLRFARLAELVQVRR